MGSVEEREAELDRKIAKIREKNKEIIKKRKVSFGIKRLGNFSSS